MNDEPVFVPFGFDKEKMVGLMRDAGIDGALLTSPENVYYTTRYTVLPSSGNPILYSLRTRLPFFVYVGREGRVTLLCWDFSVQGVEFGADEVKGFDDYEGAVQALEKHLRGTLGRRSIVGIESSCPYFVTELIGDSVKPKRFALVDNIMADLRLIKSDRELQLVRKSTEIIETTMAELYGEIYIGMRRTELIQKAKTMLFKNGATGLSHLTFSFGKANPEIAIGETLGEDTLATLDLGASYLGYMSDNRRYLYTGDVPPALQARYDLMVEIVDGVAGRLLPGARYSDVFKHAANLYAAHGIEPPKRLTHVGHNMGLETEEQWITDDPNLRVREGMVINIELYSRAETGDYIGNEETYIITPSGPARVSSLPREIRTLSS